MGLYFTRCLSHWPGGGLRDGVLLDRVDGVDHGTLPGHAAVRKDALLFVLPLLWVKISVKS